MTKNNVYFCYEMIAVEWIERLKEFKLYKIKKKNAPIWRRSVLGGPPMLSMEVIVSARIASYRNIYNIFVGHMSQIITFVHQSQKTSSQRFAEIGRGV
jgi:hypothetical protein